MDDHWDIALRCSTLITAVNNADIKGFYSIPVNTIDIVLIVRVSKSTGSASPLGADIWLKQLVLIRSLVVLVLTENSWQIHLHLHI